MKVIINGKQTSSRVRFLLQDLIDLRQDKWKPRRETAGPKKIDDIHKEIADEAKSRQLENFLGRASGRD